MVYSLHMRHRPSNFCSKWDCILRFLLAAVYIYTKNVLCNTHTQFLYTRNEVLLSGGSRSCSATQKFTRFYEPEGLLPWSQEATTGPYIASLRTCVTFRSNSFI